MDIINWLQTVPGMITTTLGTTTLGVVIANTVAFVKNIKANKDLKLVEQKLDESAETNKMLSKQNELILEELQDKDDELKRKELVELEHQETMRLLLEGLTYVISAAGGIDDVTKVAFITNANKAKENIYKKAQEIKELTKVEVAKKTEEVLDEVVDKVGELAEAAISKTTSILDKYSKR